MKTVGINHILKSVLVALVISILSASVYSSNEGAEQQFTASKSSATSNIDIDGNEEFDALTDGLLILRSMFGLTDSPLITGAVAGDTLYVDAEDIQSRIQGLGNRLDIDNDGNVDALTDGLVTLRYLFGLTGDALISGVIATGADRITAEDIEAYMAVLTSLDTEPPVFTSQETFTAPENQTAIGTVIATDANSPSIAFSISGSELSITSDGVLSFASAPDYETKTSYTATVTATDGTNSTDQSITVTVTDVDDVAPVFTSSATFSAAENQTAIDTVTATDVDTDNSAITFTVSGSELSITSDGVLSFASAPDYETKTSYTATVTATDGTNSTDQSITVTVTDVDDVAPVFTSSATFSAAENQTAIDTVTATDVDTDNSAITFTVSGSELSITSDGVLSFASAPNYETKTSYTASVTATDGTNSSIQSITVNVTNVNDNSPAFTSSATFSADENQTSIGTVTATDGDVSDSVTFTVSGSELSITSAGVLTFVSAPDYETKSSYTATVTATDGTNSTDQSVTVTVTDVDDVAPVFSSAASFSATENQTSIGTVTATDVDTSDWSISFTVSGSELAITSAGVLTFASAPDYETKSSYTATVTATDGTNSTDQSVTVTVTDVDDVAPVFTSSATFSAAENQTAIDTVTATDVDTDNSAISFSVSGSELSITSAGVLIFASAPDYETKSSYTATVTATDGLNSETQDITISITDVNEVPNFTSSPSSISVNEGQSSFDLGSMVADQDGDTIIYSLGGGDGDLFNISTSGVLTLKTGQAFDYESASSYSFQVEISDGTLNQFPLIRITIIDINESPKFTSSASFSVAENQTSVGTASASDADGDSLTYSLSGTDASSFSINGSSGVITFNSAPDYEAKTSYSMTVTVSDGTNTDTQSLTVDVTNLNDNSPQFLYWECNSPVTCAGIYIHVPENQTTVGNVRASDADGDSMIYSISGSDVPYTTLSINSSNGVMTFGTAPNYENPPARSSPWNVTLTVSDGTNTSNTTLHVRVTDLNEYSPVISSSSTFSAAENQTSVGTITASDGDTDDSLTYSLSGTDASSFSINSSGVLTFDSTPDYETKTSYSISVNVSDGTNTTSQSLTISVTDVNEAPVISTSNTGRFDIEENTANIVTIQATDPEGATLSYTTNLSGASISSEGVLTWDLPLPDYDDVYVSQNRNWSSFCQHYVSKPVGGVNWLHGADDGTGCREGTIPRDNSIKQFTVTASDGSVSTTKTFNYKTTDDTSDITLGWTTYDPPAYYRPQGGLVQPDMYVTGINKVKCKENFSCLFRLTINSYTAPDDISISMHSIQGTTTDLSEFKWVYWTDDSCRKDLAEYGYNSVNIPVSSESGYVLKIDKDCLNSSDYLLGFLMDPSPDYETIGSSYAAQPWVYLKITDGTDTTYFPMRFQIYDDPSG